MKEAFDVMSNHVGLTFFLGCVFIGTLLIIASVLINIFDKE